MMKIRILLSMIIVFTSCLTGKALYSDSEVIKIDLQFSQPDFWNQLFQNKEARIDIPAMMVVNDSETYYDVGVRFKGNSSFTMSNNKKPFNISMDAFIEDQNLWGYETLNLGNAFMDPTFVREKICYDLFRQYMPAGKVGYVALYLNGEYWGLYVNVEQVNKDFLTGWKYSNSGNLYKGDPRGRLNWIGDNIQELEKQYTKKTNEEENDWSDLIDLLDKLNHSNNPEQDLPDVLNIDQALWYIALCNLFVNLDSYVYEGHNYYIYHDPASNRFDMIPWDLNESFGCFPANRLSLSELEEFPVLYGKDDFGLPLLSTLLNVSAFREQYFAHCRILLNNDLHPDSVRQRIDVLQTLIEPYVQSDPNRLYRLDYFRKNVDESVVIQNDRTAPGIISLVKNRRDFLLKDENLSREAPEIQSLEQTPQTVYGGNTVQWTVLLSNAEDLDEVILKYKVDQMNFQDLEMLDDGLSGDGDSGDGIYGTILSIPDIYAGFEFCYYISARNHDGTCSAYPEGAEFNVCSFTVQSDPDQEPVIINEFMASNSVSVQDPQNDYDDWIEIYNRTPDPVQLNDYSLTDDMEVPGKWIFPDTTLAGYAYLLVWADNDEEDSGLHTSFALNRDGESVALFKIAEDGDYILSDFYTFVSMEEDISMARLPDGEGSFKICESPTPGYANDSSTEVNISLQGVSDQFMLYKNYPNPFNPQTAIPFYLSEEGNVAISIYNIEGQWMDIIYSGFLASGFQTIHWNACEYSAGVYFIQLRWNDHFKTIKALLLK